MNKHIALSVLGKDRPGIVETISKVLFDTGCNIEDSSMTILEGEFAMILIVALGTKTPAASLKNALSKASKKMGLTCSLRELSHIESTKEKPLKDRYIISVYGSDKPGIVYKISSFLAKNKVNITDVQTSRSGTGGKAVYVMILETAFPSKSKADDMKEQLNSIARALDVKISVHSADIPSL